MTTDETSAAAFPAWRPNGSDCELPEDTTHIWARLQELMALSWPTLAEQVERRVLAKWLSPANPRTMLDSTVLDIASEVCNVPLRADIESLRPAYAAAGIAWQNIFDLSCGDRLGPARPDANAFDSPEAYRGTRRQQAVNWWKTATGVLESLLHAEVIYDFELPDVTSAELAKVLNDAHSKTLFDGPLAIGASLYTQPSWGREHSEVRAVMEALTFATKSASRVLRDTNPEDQVEFENAAMWFNFFWQLLKGYTWKAANGSARGASVLLYLNERPGVWTLARAALQEGPRLAAAITAPLPGFAVGAREDTQAIADVTCDDLIAQIDQALAELKRSHRPPAR